jgi:hypothetical protein
MSNSINPFAPPAETGESFLARSGNFEELAGTETGLRITYYGILMILFSVIAGAVMAAIFPPAAMLAAVLIILGSIMLMVGPFFCLTAPPETGARGAIIASIVCQFLAILTTIAPYLGLQLGGLANSIGSLMGTIGTVFFIIFLMKISLYIGRPDLHAKGRSIFILAAILIGATIALTAAAVIVGPVVGIAMLGVAIGMLVAFVMYANLINFLFKAIALLRARNA